MKISRIRLTNFRNHRDTEIELDRLNIFCGPNASGKSSIKQALEICLTGRCEATDRGGRGADDLIRVGEKRAVVAAGLDPLGEVVRTISPSGSKLQVGDWTGSFKVQQELLYRELGADADLISAVINISSFLNLPPKDQAAMLHRLLPGEDDALENLDDGLREVLAAVVGDLIGPISPEQFEAIYKDLYAARREAKKELDQARGRLAGLEASASAGGQDPKLLPEMRRQLEELEAKKRELEAEKARAEAAADRRRSLAQRIEDAREEVARLKAGLERVEDKGEGVDTEDARSRLDNLLAEAKTAELDGAALATEIRELDAAVAALKKAKGKCPLSPGVIACPLKGAELEALNKDLAARRKKAVASHEAAQKKLGKLRVEADGLRETIEAAAKRENLRAELAKAGKALADLEAEMDEGLQADYHPDDLQAEIDELAARIRRGHAMIAETELTEKNRAAREAAQAAIDGMEGEVEALEKLVILFGPGPEGIRSQRLSSGLSAAEERINANLKAITGGAYRVRLEMEPEFHVIVNGPAGVVELRQLSNSERMRVGVAIAEALAHLSGLRLLVIDDAEILDERNRRMFSGYLLGLREGYDTIILLSTAQEAKEPGIPGVATFWMEDGRVARVGEAVGAAHG